MAKSELVSQTLFAVLGATVAVAGLAIRDRLTEQLAASVSAPKLSEEQVPREHYRGLPPSEFRGEWSGTVRFVDNVKEYCSDDAYACHRRGEIIMPNPCTPDEKAEVGWSYLDGSMSMVENGRRWVSIDYRTVMCHELGHANGWPGNHWIATKEELAEIKTELVERLYADDQQRGWMSVSWLLDRYATKGEAALAELRAERTVDVATFYGRGEEARLDRCIYWTMRADREGDGTKQKNLWCKEE